MCPHAMISIGSCSSAEIPRIKPATARWAMAQSKHSPPRVRTKSARWRRAARSYKPSQLHSVRHHCGYGQHLHRCIYFALP